jgi:hypothetical protein
VSSDHNTRNLNRSFTPSKLDTMAIYGLAGSIELPSRGAVWRGPYKTIDEDIPKRIANNFLVDWSGNPLKGSTHGPESSGRPSIKYAHVPLTTESSALYLDASCRPA